MILLQLEIYWYWWMLACILFLVEMLIPDIFVMSLAIAAILVGFLLLGVDLSFPWQFFAFSVLSIIGLIVSRIYIDKTPMNSDEPLLNRRGEHYVGRVFTLHDPIIDGVGQVKADSSYWNVTGPDCPAGTRVRVIGVSGIVLKIKPIETV